MFLVFEQSFRLIKFMMADVSDSVLFHFTNIHKRIGPRRLANYHTSDEIFLLVAANFLVPQQSVNDKGKHWFTD